MGDISEMMLDGTLCEGCGVLMDDLKPVSGNKLKEPPGYPRLCKDC